MKKSILFSFLILFLFSCSENKTTNANEVSIAKKVVDRGNPFKEYWYQGKAEITSYDLEQARYGELHQGHAVMIFVTEEFSNNKKVKLDNPSINPKDAVPVLKLNATRKFNTGVYPYSMMTSTFTPIDTKKYPNSLKVSSTSQEWCGHTFMQLKEQKNNFQFELKSYFESEGEVNSKVEKVFLEDEIWNRLRIDPKSLPVGNTKMLPGSVFARLRHIDYKAFNVSAEMSQHSSDKNLMTYTVVYKGINRKLAIHFNKNFPYEIEGWEETTSSGFGNNAKSLITKARKKKSIMSDYWNKHDNADLGLRTELGLE